MHLFGSDIKETRNYLPHDGTVHYYGKLLTIEMANHYLERLLTTIAWKNDEAVIYGKHIITKRKVAWYGDKNYIFTYSNTPKQALLWTKELLELKQLTEARSEEHTSELESH